MTMDQWLFIILMIVAIVVAYLWVKKRRARRSS